MASLRSFHTPRSRSRHRPKKRTRAPRVRRTNPTTLDGDPDPGDSIAMREDQLFGLVALLAVLFWVSARMMPERLRPTFERLAFILIGGGIALALVMSALHFMA